MSRTEGRCLWLPDVLRDAGLKVETVPGWEKRGKEPKEWLAQAFHHTASNRKGGPRNSLRIVTDGRPDVPGPLCNALPDRNGVWVVVAAGAANHPGVSYLPERGGISSGVKYWMLGWECENDGIGEPWPTRQLDSIEIGEAAVGAHLGWPPESNVYGHKEIARPVGRKIDPWLIDMNDHRRRVAARRTRPAPAKPAAPKPAPGKVSAPAGAPSLKRGSTGRRVAELQYALNYGTGTRLAGDASFGPSTEAAVKNLQRFFRLTTDGIYGPGSQWVLQVACGAKRK